MIRWIVHLQIQNRTRTNSNTTISFEKSEMVPLGQQTFCSTNPHFFKVILEDTSLDLKLKIPKTFVTKYGKDLSNSVCLKLPNGFEWEVKLIRCKSRAWFEEGWPGFYGFCSLAYGNFLVFRYEGNSTFEVYIFDMSCTEIDYPITVSKIDEDVDEDDDLSIEILENFSPSLRTREKPPLVCPPCKKMRTNSITVSGRISENESAHPYPMVLIENSLPNKDSHCSSSESKAGEGDILAKNNTAGGSLCNQRFLKQTLDQEAIGNSVQRATIFKPDDIHFFKITMNPSNISKSILSLPYEFSKRYLTKLPAGIATLQVLSGRSLSVKTWSVKFKHDHKNSKAQLLKGWSDFVRDNNLKVGDMCGFSLMDSFALLFEVALPNVEAPTITKSAGRGELIQDQEKRRPQIKVESECDMSDMCCEIDLSSSLAVVKKQNISGQVIQRRASSINLYAAKKFDSENPFFLVTLGLLHKEKSNVSLPASFIKSFIKDAKQTVKLQVKDRSWPVNVIRCGTNSAKFSGGWAAFAKEHQLVIGDICIFELTEINEIIMKVHIFRC